MEVNKAEALAAISQGGKKQSGRDDTDHPESEREDGEEPRREPRKEAFQVDGAIDGTIPPRVQQMLSDLAGQLEPLRNDLEVSRARERDLRERMERHPYLPVLNRQGLEHEYSRVVGHIQGLGSATFLCVSVVNAESIRVTYGRDAYEKAMAHACDVVQSVVGLSDIIGCLGGHDLGVLLLASGEAPVDTVRQRLEDILPSRLFSTGRSSLPLEIAVGGVAIERGHSFTQALQGADSDLAANFAR